MGAAIGGGCSGAGSRRTIAIVIARAPATASPATRHRVGPRESIAARVSLHKGLERLRVAMRDAEPDTTEERP